MYTNREAGIRGDQRPDSLFFGSENRIVLKKILEYREIVR